MVRVVLDTNVLVAGAYNARSASRRIVDACLAGRLVLVASPAVREEYEFVLRRAICSARQLERALELVRRCELVSPKSVPRVVADDPSDDKFLAAAVAGSADALVTNDQHLLLLGQYQQIPIVRPARFARRLEE